MNHRCLSARSARFVLLISSVLWLVAPLTAAAQEPPRPASSGTTLPSIVNDDPARLLQAADFPDIDGLQHGYGVVRGPSDVAAAQSRVGEDGGIDPDTFEDKLALLDTLGFRSHAQLNFGVTLGDDTSEFSSFVETRIARYESSRAAEAAFAVLEDESDNRERVFTDEAAPAVFGSPSEITVSEGEDNSGLAFDERNLTFQVGDALVNVYVHGTAENPQFDEDLLIAGGELLLERMALPTSELPGLAPLALRLSTDGQAVFTSYDEYRRRDGVSPSYVSDTPEFEEEQTEPSDIVDRYIAHGGFGLDATLVTNLYRMTDDDAAERFVATFKENPDPAFYADWTVVDNATELGDLTLTASYSFEYEGVDFAGYATLFQVDDIVVRIEMDSSADYGLDASVEIAEAQLACIEEGDCDLYQVPSNLLAAIDTAPVASLKAGA